MIGPGACQASAQAPVEGLYSSRSWKNPPSSSTERIACGMMIHRKRMPSPWLLLGIVPGVVAYVLTVTINHR